MLFHTEDIYLDTVHYGKVTTKIKVLYSQFHSTTYQGVYIISTISVRSVELKIDINE